MISLYGVARLIILRIFNRQKYRNSDFMKSYQMISFKLQEHISYMETLTTNKFIYTHIALSSRNQVDVTVY